MSLNIVQKELSPNINIKLNGNLIGDFLYTDYKIDNTIKNEITLYNPEYYYADLFINGTNISIGDTNYGNGIVFLLKQKSGTTLTINGSIEQMFIIYHNGYWEDVGCGSSSNSSKSTDSSDEVKNGIYYTLLLHQPGGYDTIQLDLYKLNINFQTKKYTATKIVTLATGQNTQFYSTHPSSEGQPPAGYDPIKDTVRWKGTKFEGILPDYFVAIIPDDFGKQITGWRCDNWDGEDCDRSDNFKTYYTIYLDKQENIDKIKSYLN